MPCRILCLTLAVTLLTAPFQNAQARPTVRLSLQGGGLIAIGMSGFSSSGTTGFGADFLWSVGSSGWLSIGLRQTLLISSIPFGNADGEPRIGERSNYHPAYFEWSPTLLPATSFALVLGRDVGWRATLTAGVGLIANGELGLFSLIPRPVAGVGFDATIYKTARASVGLRLQLDWVPAKWNAPMFLPQLGLVLKI